MPEQQSIKDTLDVIRKALEEDDGSLLEKTEDNVLILNKLPDKGNCFISLLLIPLRAVDTKSSLLSCPPNVQLVIFFAGSLI